MIINNPTTAYPSAYKHNLVQYQKHNLIKSKQQTLKSTKFLTVFLIFLLWSISLIAGISTSIWLSKSSIFLLKWVQITADPPNNGFPPYFTSPDILKMSQLNPSCHIFQIDLKSLQSKLEQQPRIEKVQCRFCLPDGVQIKIKERTPLAILSNRLAIDSEGVVLGSLDYLNRAEIKPENIPYLPILEGINFVQPGEIVNSRIMDSILKLLKAWQNLPAVLPLSSQNPNLKDYKINLSEPNNIKLIAISNPNFVVKLGNSDFFKNLRKLSAILSEINFATNIACGAATQYSYVDLRFAGMVVLGPKVR